MEPSVFVALDIDDRQEAERLAKTLAGPGVGFKLGPRLIHRFGADLVRAVSAHGPVFVDCKYLDIPSTMEAAVRAAFESGAQYATIHALAGPEALKRLAEVEKELSQKRPFRILSVTILTSFTKESLPYQLREAAIEDLVLGLAKDTYQAGLRGLVCSPKEASLLRKNLPESFLVTPGIRPAGAAVGDQKRIETPEAAARAGASALVVGRPILEAKDPREMASFIVAEFTAAKSQVAKGTGA